MGSLAFLDITAVGGGRVYIFDHEGRLRKTSSFAFNNDMDFTLAEPLPEDLETSCIGLPIDWLDFRTLELNIPDAETAREVLPFELDGLLMDEPSTYVIDALMPKDADALPAQEDAATARPLLAVYIQRKRLQPLIDGLTRAGLDPRFMTSIEMAAIKDKIASGDILAAIEETASLDEPARVDMAAREFENPAINMRIGEFAYKGDVKRGLKSMAISSFLLVALMLMLSLSFSLKALSASNSADALEDQVLKIYEDIFPGQKQSSARGLSYKVRSKLMELREKAESMESVDALQMLMKLQQSMPRGVRLLDITLDRDAAILKGEGDSLESIEKLRSSLESFMADVRITETGKAVSGQTGFSISAKAEVDTGGPGQ